eukprot:356980-Chlamydomonas_euryale.AAC.2
MISHAPGSHPRGHTIGSHFHDLTRPWGHTPGVTPLGHTPMISHAPGSQPPGSHHRVTFP